MDGRLNKAGMFLHDSLVLAEMPPYKVVKRGFSTQFVEACAYREQADRFIQKSFPEVSYLYEGRRRLEVASDYRELDGGKELFL